MDEALTPEQAAAYAESYARVYEALARTGMPEAEARFEASIAAREWCFHRRPWTRKPGAPWED